MSNNKKLFRSLSGLSFLSAVSAIATYVFMAIVARRLEPSEFGVFTFAWSLTYTLSGSFLSAAEAEGTRLLLNHQWSNARGIFIKAGICISLFAVLYAIFETLVAQATFLGIVFMAIIALLALFMLIEVTVRAFFASQMMRFKYGLVAPVDSLLRLVVLASLLIIGVRVSPLAVFVCMIIGTASTALIATVLSSNPFCAIKFNDIQSEPVSKARSFDFTYLLVSTLAMTFLVSGVPLIIGLFTPLSSVEIGVVGAALMITRVPLLLFMGFESVLVQEFHQRLLVPGHAGVLNNLLLVISLFIGCLGGISGYFFGPWLVARIAGHEYIVTPGSMALFSAAIGLTIGAMLLTPWCIALNLHNYIAMSWLASLAAFIVLIAIFADNINQVGFWLSISSLLCVILLYVSVLVQDTAQLRNGIHEE
jgi:O-antigen/teichoic acid export membrane protein